MRHISILNQTKTTSLRRNQVQIFQNFVFFFFLLHLFDQLEIIWECVSVCVDACLNVCCLRYLVANSLCYLFCWLSGLAIKQSGRVTGVATSTRKRKMVGSVICLLDWLTTCQITFWTAVFYRVIKTCADDKSKANINFLMEFWGK